MPLADESKRGGCGRPRFEPCEAAIRSANPNEHQRQLQTTNDPAIDSQHRSSNPNPRAHCSAAVQPSNMSWVWNMRLGEDIRFNLVYCYSSDTSASKRYTDVHVCDLMLSMTIPGRFRDETTTAVSTTVPPPETHTVTLLASTIISTYYASPSLSSAEPEAPAPTASRYVTTTAARLGILPS